MRRFIPLFGGLAVLAFANIAFAQTVTTKPVGFNTIAVAANSLKALALPIDNLPDFTGVVSTINTANPSDITIQTTSAGWVANAYAPFATNPHIIRMLSGPSQGRQYRINTQTTSDTLHMTNGTGLTNVVAGNQYEILKVQTLATMFGQNGTINGQSLTTHPTNANLADNVLIRGSSSWITFYNNGTNWIRSGPESVANNQTLLPEQGFLFVKRTGAYNFTVTGAVPITKLITDLPANKVTSLPNRFPTATTLGALGVHLSPNWNKNHDPNLADNVLIRGSTSWVTFFFDQTATDGTHPNGSWVRSGPNTTNQENFPVAIGTSVLVVRRAGTDIVLDQALPYSL